MDLDPVSPLGVVIFVFLVSMALHYWIDLSRNRHRNPEPMIRLDYTKFKDPIICGNCGAGSDEIELGPMDDLYDPCMARCTRCGSEWMFTEPIRG